MSRMREIAREIVDTCNVIISHGGDIMRIEDFDKLDIEDINFYIANRKEIHRKVRDMVRHGTTD